MNVAFQSLLRQFRGGLVECRELYRNAAKTCVEQQAEHFLDSPKEIHEALDELHKGLLVKIYVTIAESDRKWSSEEQEFAAVLFEHLWNERLAGEKLREAAQQVHSQAYGLSWYNLIRPFDQIPPLRDRVGELETLIVRLANLVAKADGQVTPSEVNALASIQDELKVHLHPLELAEPITAPEVAARTKQIRATALPRIPRPLPRGHAAHAPAQAKAQEKAEQESPSGSPEKLAEALAQLEALIGLAPVKHELRTLSNFLAMQRQREAAGLPVTSVSLHTVYGGNPGTGKTTVARIVGQILGGMGILAGGHLVETDRSGLVAEYAGQTGPKTNQKIDEALGGVLFIDEAYSLVAERDEDPYGNEAVQTLVKRMEDDRTQLVVILAGYPEELERMISSNPGLSSRFTSKLAFDDYRPSELGRIFGQLCERSHYKLGPAARARLLAGFDWLYRHRDERFGNGRLARNTFERSIRHMANRIAGIAPLTKDLLTTIEAGDLEFPSDATAALASLDLATLLFSLDCPHCRTACTFGAEFLGQHISCDACGERFEAEWAEVVEA